MPRFRPDELARWVGRAWRGRPGGAVAGVSHDTRALRPGDLYIALRGERFDGHAFVDAAFEKGAAAALVDDAFEGTARPVLPVADTLAGLAELARGYRETWATSVVGITGSVGKTTVKEMCADVLSMAGATHRTAGNYNNHIGLPLTMLAMPRHTEFGVFEIGMSHPGEIGPLAALARPRYGVMTDVCEAHRESFDSLEAIAREKACLLERVDPAGRVILDADSEWAGLFRSAAAAPVATVSLGGAADYAGRVVADRVMNVNGHDYEMPLPGEHIMRNALRAIALGIEVGLAPEAVAEGLLKFQAPPMRWSESRIRGVFFINDAYNANPLSMRAGLRTFAGLPSAGARWAVIGGMRELGAVSGRAHAALGTFVDGLGLDGVITVGALGEGIACAGTAKRFHCAGAAEAAKILREHVAAGDRVLLKASRGERLEDVLSCFKEI